MRERAWEAIASFNPSPVIVGNTTHLFYRAMGEPDALRTPGRGFSTIGYAESSGKDVFGNRRQVVVPTEGYEQFGCEDPRATFFEGQWYVFYTALGGYPFAPDNIKVAVAIGPDPDHLTEKHLVTPFNAKAATLFPERINGEIVLLLTAHTDWTADHPRPTIAIARAKNMSDFWNPEFWKAWHENISTHALPDVRRSDSEHMEVAASPVMTSRGWLLVYSHIQNYYDEHHRIFGIEALLLAANDPQKILTKTAFPFLVPEEFYERYGLVTNIVFPTGALVTGDILQIYYGAADTSCAIARLSLSDLFESMENSGRDAFMTRSSIDPIIAPIKDHAWESLAVFNAAAIDLGGSVHLLYRAMGADNTSVMGYARLEDGIHVSERLSQPIYVPREDFENKNGTPTGNSGCEDPRISEIDGTLYLCYTAYDGVRETRGALSTIPTSNFLEKNFTWSTPILLTPPNINDKDMCFFPEKMNGKVVVMHRIDPAICVDQFDTLPFDRPINRCVEVMDARPGMWDSVKVGAGAPPIRVPEGWLFIYHGVGSDHVYRLGAVLLDAETGTTVLSRTAVPILEPVLPWEKVGLINNVVFTCGVVLRGDTLFVYYGGADTAIGVATVSYSTLIKKMLPSLSV